MNHQNVKLWIIAILLFFYALITRIYQIETIPGNINPDEADTLFTFISRPYIQDRSFFHFNWNGAPALNMYIIGSSWAWSGESIMGLRFPAALFSSLAVSLFFVTAYLFSRNLLFSFLFSITLASNSWFLNFSRSAWENIFNATSVLIIVLGLYYYFEKRAYRMSLFLLILGSAAGFYFYHPGKFMFPVTSLILFSSLFVSKKDLMERIAHWFIFTLLTLFFILPQLYTIISMPEKSLHRIRDVSVLNKDNFIQPTEHLKKNMLGLLLYSETPFQNGPWKRYIINDQPPIPRLITSLYLIGMIVCLFYYPYLISMYVLLLFPPQLLSIETPDAARAIHMVPIIYLFAIIGFIWMLTFLQKYLRLESSKWYITICILSGLILCVNAYMQHTSYTQWAQSQYTLDARQPALELNEFDDWTKAVDNHARMNMFFDIQKWREDRRN